jgi:hypothetical protein
MTLGPECKLCWCVNGALSTIMVPPPFTLWQNYGNLVAFCTKNISWLPKFYNLVHILPLCTPSFKEHLDYDKTMNKNIFILSQKPTA